MKSTQRCFACSRKLGRNPHIADTQDEQSVYVGTECYKFIKASGSDGYQPPLGGPRLYLIPPGMDQSSLAERHKRAGLAS